MPRFFLENIADTQVRIAGEDARHIAKALRMHAGERLTVCDLKGTDYDCELVAVSQEEVVANILARRATASEPSAHIRLYQALPKGDKLEVIVQKAVELGVYEIAPVVTERCVVRWDVKTASKKCERLQKIALEAAKQSGRGIIPQILPVCSFENAVAGMQSSDSAILFYEEAVAHLSALLPEKVCSIAIMVGSEGGFSPDEARFAAQRGVLTASLGSRILRCETASLAALAAICYANGEF